MIAHIWKQSSLLACVMAILAFGVATAQAESCLGKETLTVRLGIKGKPGDSFRIVGFCGNTEIVRCRANVLDGNTRDRCVETGFVEGFRGQKRCVVGPQNGNSARAEVTSEGCLLN